MARTGQVDLVNIATSETLRSWGDTGGVNNAAVDLSPDGSLLAAAVAKEVKIWRIEDGAQVLSLAGHTSNVESVDFSQDGAELATADRYLNRFDVRSGELKGQNRLMVSGAVFGPSGRRLAAPMVGGAVLLFDFEKEKQLVAGGSFPLGWVQAGALVQSDEVGVLVDHDGHIVFIELASQKVIAGASLNRKIIAAGLSPSKTRLGLCIVERFSSIPGAVGAIRLSSPGEPAETVQLPVKSCEIRGGVAAVGLESGEVATVDLDTLEISTRTSILSKPALHVSRSADGQRILAASFERVFVWDASVGVRTLTRQGKVDVVELSLDGRWAAVSDDYLVRVWDLASDAAPAVLDGHDHAVPNLVGASVDAVVFSPDGRWLATGSADSTVAVWDTSTWSRRARLRGHRGPVTDLVWTGDSAALMSTSWDGTALVWTIAD